MAELYIKKFVRNENNSDYQLFTEFHSSGFHRRRFIDGKEPYANLTVVKLVRWTYENV